MIYFTTLMIYYSGPILLLMKKYSQPNEKFTVIAIDDEQKPREDVVDILKETKLFEEPIQFSSVADAYSFLITLKQPVDFIFLDIQMKQMMGTDALELLRPFAHFIVFCTGHVQYSLIAHEKLADGYLVKPLSHLYLLPLVNKLGKFLHKTLDKPLSEYIWVKEIEQQSEEKEYETDVKNEVETGRKDKKVKERAKEFRMLLDDVVYFKRQHNDVHVWTLDGNGKLRLAAKARTTIKKLWAKYEETGRFVYVNASELVQEKYILISDLKTIYIQGNWWLTVSDTGRPHMLAYMKRTNLSKS